MAACWFGYFCLGRPSEVDEIADNLRIERDTLTQAALVIKFMPTVFTAFGLRVVIYPNDHRPAHVHVIGNGCEVVFKLNCPIGPPEIRENYGFSAKALNAIGAELANKIKHLCDHWSQIHGNF